MTNLVFIAATLSMLALAIVATGILSLSIVRLLKSIAGKDVGAIPSAPSGKPVAANSQLKKSEAKMPSLATLYVV